MKWGWAWSWAMAVALAGCATPVAALQNRAPGRYAETLRVDGVERRTILRIPPATHTGPRPLVIALHGWTGNGAQMESAHGIGAEADRRGYVSVFPEGLGRSAGWNAEFIDLSGQGRDDARLVAELIAMAQRNADIDPLRIYVCGYSNGAFLTNLVGTRMGDKLAAIGAVAGTVGLKDRRLRGGATAPSVILINGRRDPTVAYDGAASALLNGISAPDSARWWAGQIGAPKNPVRTSRNDVDTDVWPGSRGREVRLVSIGSAGHEWPRNPSATTLLFDFFDTHPRRH